jgi:hypothetical protein
MLPPANLPERSARHPQFLPPSTARTLGLALRMILEEPSLVWYGFTHRSRGAVYQEYLRRLTLREPWAGFKRMVLVKPNQSFRLDGQEYDYFFSETNQTWASERCVELALGRTLLESSRGRRILEIGNVLTQYFDRPPDYTIVDKYEHRAGVLNVDVTEFTPAQPFDEVVSLSTLEHVGYDEFPRDDQKVRRALERIRGFLVPGGSALLTVPIGYNAVVDELMAHPAGLLDQVAFLRRMSLDNTWVQQDWEAVQGVKYGIDSSASEVRHGALLQSANAIAVGRIHA